LFAFPQQAINLNTVLPKTTILHRNISEFRLFLTTEYKASFRPVLFFTTTPIFFNIKPTNMKTLKFAFLFFAILSIAACTDDDDGMTTCAQSDWVGTYTGTQTCGTDTETATVTVAANGTANIVIEHVVGDSTATTTTTYDALPFDVCSLINSASGGGLTVDVNASLAGDEFTLRETITNDSTNASVTCTIVAIRN
jgi:hypothetical protein